MKVLSFFDNYFTEERRRRNYYIVYTFFFIVLSFFIFSWFIVSNRSLIWSGDGWNQHLKAHIYYAQYLRKIIRNTIKYDKWLIPDWDFYIGEGSDIVNTFHYYVIGDPVAFLSVFVPTRFMHYFCSFSGVLRLYLAGISFSVLSFGTGKKNRYAILSGALTYCFCSWALLGVARHMYFLNPMIYFPLIILGIEKIIKKQKPYLFIISTTISAISNFYFFYMIAILAIIYTIVRLPSVYHLDIRSLVKRFLLIAVYSLVSVSIAGAVFLPVLIGFAQDSRMSLQQPFHLFYPFEYYSIFPSLFTSYVFSYWVCIGLTAPAMISVFMLFTKKASRFLRILFVIGIVMFMFPIFGRLLNGMSYMTNRWSWAFDLLCAYILTDEWDELFVLEKKDVIRLSFFSVFYYLVCLLAEQSRNAQTLATIPLLFLVLIILISKDNEKKHIKQLAMIGLLCISSVNLGFWIYSPGAGNYVSECKENSKINEELDYNELQLVDQNMEKSSFARITGRNLTTNANIQNDISSTQYYWSISNPFLTKYRTSILIREPYYHNYEGYDDRTTAIALSSVNYYVTRKDNDNGIPYGYSFITSENVKRPIQEEYMKKLKNEMFNKEFNEKMSKKLNASLTEEYSLYKNDNALPLGYCYDKYISKDVYDKLDPVQKQEIQLEAVYIENDSSDLKKYTEIVDDYSIPFEVSCNGDEISETAEGFITTADNVTAIISFNGRANAETYIGFSGFDFKPTLKYDLYFGDETIDPFNLYNRTNWDLLSKDQQINLRKAKIFNNYQVSVNLTVQSKADVYKTLSYQSPDSSFSTGRHDYIVNLGYREDPETQIIINFPIAGKYNINKLKVYSVPMDNYVKKTSLLKEDPLNNIKMENDCISGTINLKGKKILVISVPYSIGWRAFIDGKETDTFVANERHIGIEVPKGFHNVTFRYSMPYKYQGLVLSIFGVISFAVIVILNREKCKRNRFDVK